MGDTDTEDAHSAVDVRSEGTDEDEEYEMEEEDDEEEEEDDTLKRPANRRFGVKEPQFQAGSNEIDSANVVQKGRRAVATAATKKPTHTSTTTTKSSTSTSTSTKKRTRATERAALQPKKKPRQEDKPTGITEKERKKASKNAKEVATSRSKLWRQILLGALEDHRGKLPPSDLFKLILDSKLTQTARWFADLGLGRHQVWFAFVV